MEEKSLLKRVLLEACFLVGVLLAVVLSTVDIVFGIVRYVIGRLRGKPNFNPWANLTVIWRMIWLHGMHLVKMLEPTFRESVRKNRTAIHTRAVAARNAFARTRDIHVFDDFDYVEAADVFTFFMILPYGIILGAFLVQAVIALVTVFSLYGVYKYHQNIATVPAKPQPRTVVKYQPQVADEQDDKFGPTWLNRGAVLDKVNDPSFRNIAMLSSGGIIKYSGSKIADPKGFAPYAFSEMIQGATGTPTGQVGFVDQFNQEYVVNKLQAFVFEGNNTKVFMFDEHGTLMAADPGAVTFR